MAENRKRSCWPEVVAGVAVIVLAGIAIWQHQTRASALARLEAVEAESRALHARFEDTRRELAELRNRQLAPSTQKIGPPEISAARPGDVESARLLIQVREKLAAAGQSVRALETRVRELEASLEKVSGENRRLAASEADLKETAAATNRIVDAMRVELKGKDERLAQLMATNTQLLEQYRQSAKQLDAMPKLVRDLEEIDRRREAYLNGILRRYRDITDQYRSLAARAEDRPDAGAGATAADVSRIQNAIQMAEDDLRQLSALNAEAGRLRRRLSDR